MPLDLTPDNDDAGDPMMVRFRLHQSIGIHLPPISDSRLAWRAFLIGCNGAAGVMAGIGLALAASEVVKITGAAIAGWLR